MPRGKKGSGPSRSQLIRDALKQSPGASAKDIVEALAQRGVKVSAGLVYMNKGRLNQAKVHKRRKLKRLAGAAANSKASDPVALIRKVRELAMEAGGYESLKELIGVLDS